MSPVPTIAPTRRPGQGRPAPFHKATGPSGVGVLDQNPRILRARQEGLLRAEQWRPGEHRPGRLGKAAVDAPDGGHRAELEVTRTSLTGEHPRTSLRTVPTRDLNRPGPGTLS
ncbi:hypothetical protein [Streptomyces umbrinus]|uniref:hypothetical protein n=1 Tax=Streptomyces umbrinus TaxID=67370 RepID=UPI0033C4CBE3